MYEGATILQYNVENYLCNDELKSKFYEIWTMIKDSYEEVKFYNIRK
jgi:hypothetical protein